MFISQEYLYILALFALFLPIYLFIWHLYAKIRFYEQKIINSNEFNYLTQLLSFVAQATSARLPIANKQLCLNSSEMKNTEQKSDNIRQIVQKSILTIADIIVANCDSLPESPEVASLDHEQKIESLRKAFPYQMIEDTIMNFILGC